MIGDAPFNTPRPASGMQTGGASRPASNGAEALNDRIQMQIGQGLRAMYDAVLAESIPDDLLELLRQADRPAKGAAADQN